MSKLNHLSVITDEISQDFENALKTTSEFGIKQVDLRTIWNKNIALFTDEELKQLKGLLEKYQIKVIVITSPFAKCVLPSSHLATSKKKSLSRNPEFNLSLFDRIIEISDFFNTPYIRIFSFFKLSLKTTQHQWNEMIEILRPCIQKAQERKKILLLENDHGLIVSKIEETKKFFKEINSTSIKLLLDPGNFFMDKESTLPEAYDYFYEQNLVAHMHVKDPKRRIPILGAIFTTVGEGKINYKPLLEQAFRNNFEGNFILETHALRNKEVISKKSLETLSIWLKELE